MMKYTINATIQRNYYEKLCNSLSLSLSLSVNPSLKNISARSGSFFKFFILYAVFPLFSTPALADWTTDADYKKEYGTGNVAKYYEWQKNDNDNYELKEVAAPTPNAVTITARYDDSNPQERFQNTTGSWGDIEGNFLEQNHIVDSCEAYGGAIYNYANGGTASIKNITGDFIGNSSGGAIYNETNEGIATIGNITGDFIDNEEAIINKGSKYFINDDYDYSATIGNITSNFIGNNGAINNYHGRIGNITGDFIGNYHQDVSQAYGGAISTDGTIGNITGNFISNYADSISYASGGAIANCKFAEDGTIGDITGNFVGNFVKTTLVDNSEVYEANGGAIANKKTIGNITGDFIGNYVQSQRGALGGAISNQASNSSSATIVKISGDFIGNFVKGYADTQGGAIYNAAKDGGTAIITLNNANFTGNYAHGRIEAQGGALWNNSKIMFTGNSSFSGNYIQVGDVVTPNGIYNRGIITLTENATVTINDGFNGDNGTIELNAGSVLNLNAPLTDNGLSLTGATLNINNQHIAALDVSFDEHSTLKVTVNSLEDYGSLSAENLSIAEGATLEATLAQGIVPQANTPYEFILLTSGNEFINNFTDTYSNNMYDFHKKVGEDGVYEIIQRKTASEVSAENGGSETNQGAADAWVDGDAFTDPKEQELANDLATLAQRDGVSFNEALTALAPTEMPVVQAHTVEQSNRLFGAVSDHLQEHRNSVAPDASLWLKTYAGTTEWEDKIGFDTDSYGVVIGLDKQFDRTSKAGIGYAYDDTDIDSSNRTYDVKTHSIFAYGEHRKNDWFVNAIAAYNMAKYDETKHTLGRAIGAEYDVNTLSAQVMTGYEIKTRLADVTPQIGARYYHIDRDGYTDDAGQKVSAEDMNVATVVANLKAEKSLRLDNGMRLRPQASVGVTYDVVADKNDAVVSLGNGSSYVVNGQRLNRFGVEAGAGVSVSLTDKLEASVNYLGAFRQDYTNHTAMLGLKYKF